MRVALLTCAVAAAAIPVIVYFATAALMERQEDLSDRLISSVAHAAELNATLIRLSEATDRLGRLDDPAEVETVAANSLAGIDALRDGFTASKWEVLDQPEGQKIATLLSSYEASIAEVADNRLEQLNTLREIEGIRTEIFQRLRGTNTDILSNIAATNSRFESQMLAREQPDSAASSTALSTDFQNLMLYRALNRLLDDFEEDVTDIDPAVAPKDIDAISARFRFLIRGLTVRTAKVPDAALRVTLAQAVRELDTLGSESLVAAYQRFNEQSSNGEQTAAEQSKIGSELLYFSDVTVTSTKAAAVEGSNSIAEMVRENRLVVLGLSSLLLLVLLGLLFYVVGRGFSRRIGLLTDGVLAIAQGDLEQKTEIGGNDELTDMGDALRVFRANRRDLVRSNQELEDRNLEVREVGMQLQTILDTTTSGIIAFDHNGEIAMVNLPARHFMGGTTTPTPFVWPDHLNFLDSSDLSPLEASKNPIMRALAGQQLKSEVALLARIENKAARYMRISSAIVPDKASDIRCVVVLEDVSEAEKNRQQVERAGRLDALGQLTGGIAHDFNNLLATIEYALELSLDTGVNAEAEDYLKTAVTSVRRGSELTARLLSFAKRQPGLARSQKVSDILREFRALVEPSIEAVLKLKFEEPASDMYVYCDGGQLENALLNLVLNSRDAILRGGRGDQITVSVREVIEADADFAGLKEQDTEAVHRGVAAEVVLSSIKSGSTRYIEFTVADNGPGMTVEVKRRALDPFFTTKDTNSGTGLGLSMVYGFVQHSDGELRMYSEEGHGTTVRLLIPSGSPEGEREGPVLDLPVQIGNGERILIVEDDDHLRDIMEKLVRSLGYITEVSSSGPEALAALERGDACDLLLTDIIMPGGISGFELGEKVRALRPSIPIVYMSGYAGFTETEMGTAIGKFIQKPCAPSELSRVIAEALSNDGSPE